MIQDIRSLVADQLQRYPALTVQDLVKALYQREFGCGHLLADEHQALAYLTQEAAVCTSPPGVTPPLTEPLHGPFCRVHLQAMHACGLSVTTLHRLFVLSAREKTGSMASFLQQLDALEDMAAAGSLPLSAQETADELARYRSAGCPAMRHSEAFRAAYAPAYRVVRSDYARYLPLFARIDQLMARKGQCIVAIDGPSASGKSTLAALLVQVYGCTVLHMDDYFLQPHQRTPQRYAQPGGNVDHERFLQEALAPLRRGEPFISRPFDCHTMAFTEPVMMPPSPLTVVEGVYSLHPTLEASYDLSVFLQLDKEEQSRRILHRNGPEMHARFMNEWIPLEDRYFSRFDTAQRCELRIDAN